MLLNIVNYFKLSMSISISFSLILSTLFTQTVTQNYSILFLNRLKLFFIFPNCPTLFHIAPNYYIYFQFALNRHKSFWSITTCLKSINIVVNPSLMPIWLNCPRSVHVNSECTKESLIILFQTVSYPCSQLSRIVIDCSKPF